MTLIASDKRRLVVGLGPTGLSCARHLARLGLSFDVVDSREAPPCIDTLRNELPGVKVHVGGFDERLIEQASELIVSPGISLEEAAFAPATARGISVSGDIDLFADAAKAPVVAITGSNGKSTVTSLVGLMTEEAGWKAAVGGNLGTPALDLLDDDNELYVLELSSFQLERCHRLQPKVAALLNVSADHMDRYKDLVAYHRAKQRIFRGAAQVVSNRFDDLTQPLVSRDVRQFTFGLGTPDRDGFGLLVIDGQQYLGFEQTPWIAVRELQIVGKHNIENALAAMAIGYCAGIPQPAIINALMKFEGLPHRCEYVATVSGVKFYNDSKGTNVGAAQSAIRGLASDSGKVIWIAGGDGKGADFSPLATVADALRAAVLIGKDAAKIAAVLPETLPVLNAQGMYEAVSLAESQSKPGDTVLLSPACASFDMFQNYAHRGEVFTAAVHALMEQS